MFPSTLQDRLEWSPDPNYLSIRWDPYAIFHFSPLLGAILQHPAGLQSQEETLSYLILSILFYFSLPAASFAQGTVGKNLLWVGFQGPHPIKFNGSWASKSLRQLENFSLYY